MDSTACVPALRALGEESRLRILRLLLHRRMSVNEIADEIGASQYNVSRHLRVLREAGLLEIEKSGQQRFYSVPARLRKSHTLDLGCCTFRLDQPVIRTIAAAK